MELKNAYLYMKTVAKYGNNVFLFSVFLIELITSIWYPDATFRIPYLYCLCGLLLIAFHLLHWQTKIYFSWIDILIFIPLVSNGNDIFKYHMEGQIGTFLIFYLLSKTATTENRIANLLTISGCFQVFLMLAQFFDCLPFNHSIFPCFLMMITGQNRHFMRLWILKNWNRIPKGLR